MAQTAQQIITGALKFMRVLGANESPTADDADNALTQLNDYLNGLNGRGAVFPSVTLVLTDTVPIAQQYEGDLKRALAKYMTQDWGGAPMPPKEWAECVRADQRIVAAHTTIDPAGSDYGLQQMPSQRRPNLTGRLV